MSYFATTTINATAGNPVPTIGEGDWALRRILKVLENQGAVDGQQRQRMTVDAMTAGLTLSTVTTLTTCSTVSTVSNVAAMAGMGDEQFINISRETASNCIRRQLTFSGAVSGP